jgi:hypothetical protein
VGDNGRVSDTEQPADPSGVPAPAETASQREVSIRRAPKFGVFIVGGGVLGFIVTFFVILATLHLGDGASVAVTGTSRSSNVGFWGLVGYFSFYGVVGGGVLGALVAVVIDWRLSRRPRRLTAEHLGITMPPETVEGDVEDGDAPR